MPGWRLGLIGHIRRFFIGTDVGIGGLIVALANARLRSLSDTNLLPIFPARSLTAPTLRFNANAARLGEMPLSTKAESFISSSSVHGLVSFGKTAILVGHRTFSRPYQLFMIATAAPNHNSWHRGTDGQQRLLRLPCRRIA